MHMQELKLMLNATQWTAKQLSGVFSVSFFWPASTACNQHNLSVVLKRRKNSNNGSGTKPRESPSPNAEEGTTLAAHPSTAVPVNTPPPPPSDAHPEDPAVSNLSSTEDDSSGSDSIINTPPPPSSQVLRISDT